MKSLQQVIQESLVNEAMSIERLLSKHAEDGYVIVSASRGERSAEENKRASTDLSIDIKDAGYAFKRVLGGYVEDNGQDVNERAFIVFCRKRGGKLAEFSELRDFALEMCGKYGQECVLIAEPGTPPYYADADGKTLMKFSSQVAINRAAEQYFTKIGGSKLTFKGAVTEQAHSVADRTCRHYMGEIF